MKQARKTSCKKNIAPPKPAAPWAPSAQAVKYADERVANFLQLIEDRISVVFAIAKENL